MIMMASARAVERPHRVPLRTRMIMMASARAVERRTPGTRARPVRLIPPPPTRAPTTGSIPVTGTTA